MGRILTQMNKKRHEILGKDLHCTWQETLDSIAEAEANRVRQTEPGQPQQQFSRELQIGAAVNIAVYQHLGYGPMEDLEAQLNRGLDRALEYFFGDWWVTDEFDSRCLDKTRPDRALIWFDALADSLLLGGLTGRWDDIAKICSWFDETIEMQYQAGTMADEYMLMFLCIASSLRPDPTAAIDDMVAVVKACRTRRPKLLCALWEAALAKDQKAFKKALKDSVKQFLKYDAEDVPSVRYWVALHPSFLWLLAERNGLEFPTDLPEDVDAAIVRRQTIGLA